MRSILAFCVFLVLSGFSWAQNSPLPNGHAPGELDEFKVATPKERSVSQFTTPPTFEVRTMAEWEEIKALMITWEGFSRILKQITAAAREECEVVIMAEDVSEVESYLYASNAGGEAFENLDNVTIIEENLNTIWCRDFGGHTIYRDDVDEPAMVDWIYNRNRPDDDLVPLTLAEYFDLDVYSTIEEPWDLMATGGNFMSDGLGTAFSSELILEENDGGFAWSGTFYPDHTELEIDNVMQEFMGIDTYIKMETLPYDGIHHIDMHMKLLDEETIIIGEYPDGVADGPQIEANMEYVLSNYSSAFGTPYEIIRIQMPPEGGAYPNTNGAYRTYTNMVFVNKIVLLPVYETTYDEPALEILGEALPGYTIVPIQCNDIIELSGAIHCITKAVGVDDPLWIVHDDLEDTEDEVNPYAVVATAKHISGIEAAILNYRIDNGVYQSVPMVLVDEEMDEWMTSIPAQPIGTTVDYYIDATANSGKQLSRPIVAPEGTWTFQVTGTTVGLDEVENNILESIYPNPGNAVTVIPFDLPEGAFITLSLKDMAGRTVDILEAGFFNKGLQKVFFDASQYAPGVYSISLFTEEREFSRRFMVK